MERRGFLKSLAGLSVAAQQLRLEELFVPKRTFFIPKPNSVYIYGPARLSGLNIRGVGGITELVRQDDLKQLLSVETNPNANFLWVAFPGDALVIRPGRHIKVTSEMTGENYMVTARVEREGRLYLIQRTNKGIIEIPYEEEIPIKSSYV